MFEIGLVVEADSKKVKIRVPRTSACGGNCAQCGSACGDNSGIYTAENAQGLQVGDRVRLTMTAGRFVLNMLLGYGILIAALLGGILLGYFFFHTDGKALLTGILIFLAAIIIQRRFFKNRKQKIRIEKIGN